MVSKVFDAFLGYWAQPAERTEMDSFFQALACDSGKIQKDYPIAGCVPEIPKEMLEYMEEPDPFWDGKTVKETHIPGYVQSGATLKKLLESQGYSSKIAVDIEDRTGCQEGYWFLITKKTVPFADQLGFEQRSKKPMKYTYSIAKPIEVTTAILVAKHFGHPPIFSEASSSAFCGQNTSGGGKLAIGSDPASLITIHANSSSIGSHPAGAIRFPVREVEQS